MALTKTPRSLSSTPSIIDNGTDGHVTINSDGSINFNTVGVSIGTDGSLTTSTENYATQTYVDTELASLVDSSPEALNTLNELAAALGDDPNFATTVNSNIASKLSLSGGTMTGNITLGSNSIGHGVHQQETTLLAGIGSTNGPVWKVRYDGATANRYVDFGQIDGLGNWSTGLKLYNNQDLIWKTNRFVVKENTYVGIGTNNPSYKLHIDSIGGGGGIALQDDNDAGSTGLHFLNNTGTVVAEIEGLSDNTGMTFKTNGSERARIDASGNLLVGKSGENFGVQGIQLKPSGASITNDSQVVLALNRLGTDGQILNFHKDSLPVGSIGSRAGTAIYIESGGTGTAGLDIDGAIAPRSGGGLSNGTVDLGTSGYRFRDLYLSGGVIASRLQLTSQYSAAISVTADFYSGLQELIPVNTLPSGTYLITITTSMGNPIYYCNTAFIMQTAIGNGAGSSGVAIKMLSANHTGTSAHWEIKPKIGAGSKVNGLLGQIIYGSTPTGTATVKAKRLS